MTMPANVPTTAQLLEWLDAWSQPWRWEVGFRQYERWSQWRRTADKCYADAYKAHQRAENFPDANPASLAAQWRSDGASAEKMADNQHAIALRDDGQRLQIANWLRANKLFDAFEEFPTRSSFGERPSAEDVREAARQMQRVRARVEAFLTDGAPEAGKPATPGFLGLAVDDGGTVRREGKPGDVTLTGLELDLFTKALAANGRSVSITAWRAGYAGELDGMRVTVSRLNDKVRSLGLRVENRALTDVGGAKSRRRVKRKRKQSVRKA